MFARISPNAELQRAEEERVVKEIDALVGHRTSNEERELDLQSRLKKKSWFVVGLWIVFVVIFCSLAATVEPTTGAKKTRKAPWGGGSRPLTREAGYFTEDCAATAENPYSNETWTRITTTTTTMGGGPRRCVHRSRVKRTHANCEAYCRRRGGSLANVGRDKEAFEAWLAAFGIAEPACSSQASYDDWGDFTFGFIGLYQQHLWKAGVGRKTLSHRCGWSWTDGGRGIHVSQGGAKAEMHDTGEFKDQMAGHCGAYAYTCVPKDAKTTSDFDVGKAVAIAPCDKARHCLCMHPGRTSEAYDKWGDPGDTHSWEVVVFFVLASVAALLVPVRFANVSYQFQAKVYNSLTDREKRNRLCLFAFLLPAAVLFNALAFLRPKFTRCRVPLYETIFIVMAALSAWVLAFFAVQGPQWYPFGGDIYREKILWNLVTWCVCLPPMGLALAGAALGSWKEPGMDTMGCVAALTYCLLILVWQIMGAFAAKPSKVTKTMLDVLKRRLGARSPALADVAQATGEYVRLLQRRRQTEVGHEDEQTGRMFGAFSSLKKKTNFEMPKDRLEVKVLVRLLELFQSKIISSTKTFLHLGGLTKHESDVLEEFHEAIGAYLAFDVNWARDHTEDLARLYHDIVRGHKHLYRTTHDTIRRTDREMYNKVVFESLEAMRRTAARATAGAPILQPPPHNIITLYTGAWHTESRFADFALRLSQMIEPKATYVRPSVKGLWRVAEKMGMCVEGYRREHAGTLLDVVRGSILFDNMTQIDEALTLLACCDVHTSTDDVVMGTKIEVLRVKNRFSEPTAGGWADALVNFRFYDPPGEGFFRKKNAAQHVCELQLIHKKMQFVRKDWGAHESYGDFRTAVQLLEGAGRLDIIARVDQDIIDEEAKYDALQRGGGGDTSPGRRPSSEDPLAEVRSELDAWFTEAGVRHLVGTPRAEKAKPLEKFTSDLRHLKNQVLSTLRDKDEEIGRLTTALRSVRVAPAQGIVVQAIDDDDVAGRPVRVDAERPASVFAREQPDHPA